MTELKGGGGRDVEGGSLFNQLIAALTASISTNERALSLKA